MELAQVTELFIA